VKTLGYLDPGTGTMILQMIAGAVAAAAVVLKMFGRRILRALHLTKAGAGEQPEATSPVGVPEHQVQDR